MAIAVSDAGALKVAQAIDRQTSVLTTQLGAINTLLTNNFSPLGANVPLTPVAIARAQGQSINDMHMVMTNMLNQQQLIVAALEVVQSGMASVSSQIAAGVSTAQVATADQINANKFQQQTTNASLKRADLPETEVTEESFLESTKKRIDDTLTFKSQIAATSLIEGQISSAVSQGATELGNMVSRSFIGEGARKALGAVKTWLGLTQQQEEQVKTVSEAAAITRAGLLGDTKPPLSGGKALP
jgi:hypothetical protein